MLMVMIMVMTMGFDHTLVMVVVLVTVMVMVRDRVNLSSTLHIAWTVSHRRPYPRAGLGDRRVRPNRTGPDRTGPDLSIYAKPIPEQKKKTIIPISPAPTPNITATCIRGSTLSF